MNDRELLELAAKAAGIGINWQRVTAGVEIPMIEAAIWNPLTDDGDALRLASALNIDLMFDLQDEGGTPIVAASFALEAGGEHGGLQEPVISGAQLAATRRAIVRAAAEIGKHA